MNHNIKSCECFRRQKKLFHNIFEIVYFKVKIVNANTKVRLILDKKKCLYILYICIISIIEAIVDYYYYTIPPNRGSTSV